MKLRHAAVVTPLAALPVGVADRGPAFAVSEQDNERERLDRFSAPWNAQ